MSDAEPNDLGERLRDPTGSPGVDGTPAWAYDEDGYCVCCGNGRWKYHRPDCELRDALDAEAVVRDLAAIDNEPWAVSCPWDCAGEADGSGHDESCPWRRAKELMSDV